MPSPASKIPINAWFTLQGKFIGLSGIPIRLAPGQQIDPSAWYTPDGHRAAIAGPFRDEAMNRQGYLRGGQILAAEKMQLAALRSGAAPNKAAPSGLPSHDRLVITITGIGGAVGVQEKVIERDAKILEKIGERLGTKAGGLVTESGELIKVTNGTKWYRSYVNGIWYDASKNSNQYTGRRVLVEKASEELLKRSKSFQVAGQAITQESKAVLSTAGVFKNIGKVCFYFGSTISIIQFEAARRSHDKDRGRRMFKAGLDFGMGVAGTYGGWPGLIISVVYFVVDTAIYIDSNGKKNILDLPEILGDLLGPLKGGTLTQYGPHDLFLVIQADNTHVAVPRRVKPRTLDDILSQTPIDSHNAVFRPAFR